MPAGDAEKLPDVSGKTNTASLYTAPAPLPRGVSAPPATGSGFGAQAATLSNLSPPDTCRSSMDTENPFADVIGPRDLRTERSFSDLDESSSHSLSAFYGDEFRNGPAAQPWRIPPALVRKQSTAAAPASESSPLRWSYSSRMERPERGALERSESFQPTRRRLSVSSVSLESLNTKCVTPRRASMCAAQGGSDSPLSSTSLRHLSSSQAARILKSDTSTVDPYVN